MSENQSTFNLLPPHTLKIRNDLINHKDRNGNKIQGALRIGGTTLHRLMKKKGFPKPHHLSDRLVAWSSDEVNDWVQKQMIQDYQPDAKVATLRKDSLKTKGKPDGEVIENQNASTGE
jgi:predicted DNA-binding transcriptional regulator AlpA